MQVKSYSIQKKNITFAENIMKKIKLYQCGMGKYFQML